MTAPKVTTNAQMYYEIEQGEGGQFSEMPEWLQDKIRASQEFANLKPRATATADEDSEVVPF